MGEFVLISTDCNGAEAFYTGRAGAAWIGAYADAFTFANRELANRQVERFNSFTPLHRLTFRVRDNIAWANGQAAA